MNQQAVKIYNSFKARPWASAYDRAGVYAILLDGKTVYVGKSTNMLIRMAEHYASLSRPTEHKYQVLKEAKAQGFEMRFKVLHTATAQGRAEIEEEIGEREGYYIRTLRPALNHQIPKAENWRTWDTNPRALAITLSEIIKKGNTNASR